MNGGLDTEMFQRLVLANQYEILANLEPDLADDYLDLAQQVRSWWPLESLPPVRGMSEIREDALTAQDQGLVLDVLELFDALQRADREGKVGEEDRNAVAFAGFCGNYEGKYLGFLEWLRDHERFRYVRLRDPEDANAHMPMLALYRRMLDKWRELGRPRNLSAAEASAIFGERRRLRFSLNARSEPEWTDAVEPD
jgi:hypothetical protein